MNQISRPLAAALLLGSMAAQPIFAQTKDAMMQPKPSATATSTQNDSQLTQPQTAVAPVVYRSVFKETSLGIEQEKLDWRKANNEVGRFERGHVDILKSEEMDEKKATAISPAAKPIMPAPSPTPARAPNTAPAHKH